VQRFVCSAICASIRFRRFCSGTIFSSGVDAERPAGDVDEADLADRACRLEQRGPLESQSTFFDAVTTSSRPPARGLLASAGVCCGSGRSHIV
jgi:hypothetical protein